MNYKITIPNGEPSGWMIFIDRLPAQAEVNWNNVDYLDGHKEGVIYPYPDNNTISYYIETVVES